MRFLFVAARELVFGERQRADLYKYKLTRCTQMGRNGEILIKKYKYEKEGKMPYLKAKIYKQGGHFIAIPHTEQPHKERRKAVETEIFVEDPPDETSAKAVEIAPLSVEESKASETESNPQIELTESKTQAEMPKPKRGRITTKRKLFDELYKTYYSEKKRTRRKLILQAMLPYFKTADDAAIFAVMPITEAEKAHDLLYSGKSAGKVVLKVCNEAIE